MTTGDILNIDVTVILDGWYGDSSRMYWVGTPSVKAQNLTRVTYECLMRAIDIVRPGVTLGDIGHVIQSHAEANRFSVVRDFTGHGLGTVFHTAPTVLHYGQPGTGLVLEEGMFFTIEPMINAGHFGTKILNDGWTAVTRDKSLSAQFEHTIGVTETGVEIFTTSARQRHAPPLCPLRLMRKTAGLIFRISKKAISVNQKINASLRYSDRWIFTSGFIFVRWQMKERLSGPPLHRTDHSRTPQPADWQNAA